ncbi:C4-dicarboxylate ABC transporter [Primorskyibacter flagellatus]|uniref:TRAP transporter small permease protein n=1 Tax=Primorskyibacter flagellatus TaxID=1387277 RepID=A0A917E909_9RHOB|nr:TRAP transporter small permease subunit [Primorskyibacter flagellatus]GGE15861.1 C4-dicarboxylate ABC transporter [Primorskyibacter flagellatus]
MSFLRRYVALVDGFNYRLGRVMMYGIFALMAVLGYSTFSKVAGTPSLWTLEMAQFFMVGYYILGGPYAMQMGSNVRMDLFYGDFTPRRKAWFDAITVFFLLVYLGILLWGGIESTIYAFQYGGERSPSAWRPYMWPIKVVMCVGIALMLLQALSELAKDILYLKTGEPARADTQAEPGDAL